MEKQNDYMKIAHDEAQKGMKERDGGPFGAVIVKDGVIIAVGHNMVISDNDSTAHAEIKAIRIAESALGTYDLNGCELYTTCYPCPMCLGAILWARISKVRYACTSEEAAEAGFDDKDFYDEMQSDSEKKLIDLEHTENIDCSELFKAWSNLKDHKIY